MISPTRKQITKPLQVCCELSRLHVGGVQMLNSSDQAFPGHLWKFRFTVGFRVSRLKGFSLFVLCFSERFSKHSILTLDGFYAHALLFLLDGQDSLPSSHHLPLSPSLSLSPSARPLSKP